jgi:hypothetical protein
MESGVLIGVKAERKPWWKWRWWKKTLVEVEARLAPLTGYVHFAVGLTCMGGSTVPLAKKQGISRRKRKGC